MSRIPLLHFVIVLISAGIVSAGDDVVARVRPAVVMPGQRAVLEIEAPEALLDRLPDPPAVPGLAMEPQGANRVRRGNEARIVAYHVIEPEKTGVIPIPPFQVPLAGGRTITTQPLELTVVGEDDLGPPPPSNRRLHALLLTPRRTYFTGEQFPVQALVMVDPEVYLQNLEQPKLPREGFAIDRFENPVRGEVSYAGRRWATFAFTARATAMASGEMSLGPLEAKAVIGIPEDGGNGFFRRYRDFPLTASSEARVLDIKPFPPNPPPGFEGAVGKFTLEANFDPAPVKPEDPVAVRVTVRGTGDVAQISTPRLADESGWEFFEGAREESPRDTSDLRSEVTFRRILRPKVTPGPTLPPFTLVYLDPTTGLYETARSNALSLPTAVTGPAATTSAASPALPTGGPPTIVPPLPPAASLTPKELLLSFPPETKPRWMGDDNAVWLTGWWLHGLGLAGLCTMAGLAWRKKFAATEAGRRAACRRAFRSRLRQVTRTSDAQTRLLESLRWFEDWQQSPLARPLTTAESAAVDQLRAALAAARYARSPHPSPATADAARLASLLQSPRP